MAEHLSAILSEKPSVSFSERGARNDRRLTDNSALAELIAGNRNSILENRNFTTGIRQLIRPHALKTRHDGPTTCVVLASWSRFQLVYDDTYEDKHQLKHLGGKLIQYRSTRRNPRKDNLYDR